MNNFLSLIESKLVPLAGKMGSNKILGAISSAFNTCLPIIVIGAIFSLLSSLQLGPYQEIITSLGLSKLFVLPPKFTTDVLSLYIVFLIAYRYVQDHGIVGGGPLAGSLALLSFLILTPLANVTVNDVTTTYLAFDYLGAKGLFCALLVGIVVGYVYCFIIDHNWVIKMPEGVPPAVSQAFSALVPGFIITSIFLMIYAVINGLTGVTFSEWLYALISAPLSSLSGSLVTFLILNFIASLFWFFGLHGGQIILPFSIMLFFQAGVENQMAFAAGDPMTNIITMSFSSLFMLGGTGQTLGLVLDMLFFSKSKQYKSLGKLAFLPSLCGINEPVLFGLPIILNPVLALPFFIVPELLAIITYTSMSIGLVSLPRVSFSAFGTPVLLDGWVIAGISGVILQVVLILISMACYYPFFKAQDNIAVKEEN